MAKLVLALIKIDGGHNLLGSNFGIYKAPWQHGRSQDGITVGKERGEQRKQFGRKGRRGVRRPERMVEVSG